MIEVACSSCGKQYRLADELSGKRVRCKECGETIAVPELAPAGAIATLNDDDIAVAPAPAPVAAPSPAKPAAPMFAAAPSPMPGAPAGKRWGFRINRFAIVLGVIGVFLLMTGVKEMRLANAASPTPQDISCLELEKSGPGKNAYVRVSKFLTTGGGVYQKEEHADNWQMVWLPLIAKDGEYAQRVRQMVLSGAIKTAADLPAPDHVRVIVKSSKVRTQADIDSFDDQHKTLTGMVINQVETMSEKEKRLLQESYPGSDLDACWIIEEGREPASSAKYLGMMGGGLALLLLGLWMTFKPA
ncbi:MAG TPA: hypothetical protein VLI90_05965 [Tepidisphaeraceae bacterium]|nr:hypothetical protein [Tepidisphaeraceae bacterium]